MVSQRMIASILTPKMQVILLSLLLVGLTTMTVLASSHTYDYTDSVLSLHGHTYPQWSGSEYRHEGQTYGQAYGSNLAYLRVRVYSRDETESMTCHLRNTDSGNVYNVSTVTRYTNWRSVLTCTGSQYHEYRGLGEHWFGSTYVQTNNNW